jgi:HEXXH motif-containing protein
MNTVSDYRIEETLVDAWLRPSGYLGPFRERAERAQDRAVAAACRMSEKGSAEDARTYIAAQVAANPGLLRRVSGQAGLELSADPGHTGSEDVRVGMEVLAVELAALAGDDREAVLPHRPSLLLPVSGLAVDIDTAAEIRLEATVGGLRVTADNQVLKFSASADRHLLAAPSAVPVRSREIIGEIRIEQHWDLLEAPVAGFLEPTEIIPAPLASNDRLIVQRAIQLLRLATPELHDELVQLPVSFVPLAARPGVLRQSASLRQLPGVVYANLQDPFELLDLIVHEYSHLKLYLLEADGPLMSRPDVKTLAPWRKDRRTAQGLFHGIYVFHQVAYVFDRVFGRWAPSERGETRAALLRVCVARGLRLLDEADVGLTPLAGLLAARMRAENDAGLARLRQLNPATTTWAEKVVSEHLEQAGQPDSGSGGPWFFS